MEVEIEEEEEGGALVEKLNKISTLYPIIDIEAHIDSYCLIDIHHNVYMKGDNSKGQLGLGETITDKEEFTLLPDIKAKKAVFGFWTSAIILRHI